MSFSCAKHGHGAAGPGSPTECPVCAIEKAGNTPGGNGKGEVWYAVGGGGAGRDNSSPFGAGAHGGGESFFLYNPGIKIEQRIAALEAQDKQSDTDNFCAAKNILAVEKRLQAIEAQLAELKPKDEMWTQCIFDGEPPAGHKDWFSFLNSDFKTGVFMRSIVAPEDYAFLGKKADEPKAEPVPRKTLGEIARETYPFLDAVRCEETWSMVAEAVAEAIIERHLEPILQTEAMAALIAAIRAEFK